MFKITSDITMALRKEFDVAVTGAGQPLASGVTGSWVTLDSSGKAILTTGATGLAFPIWNESYRDGTIGAFTPDVVNSKRVVTIAGVIFATTDQYSNTTPILRGDPLMTAAGGILVKNTAIGTYPIVAYCVQPQYSTSYFGRTLNAIDIVTV